MTVKLKDRNNSQNEMDIRTRIRNMNKNNIHRANTILDIITARGRFRYELVDHLLDGIEKYNVVKDMAALSSTLKMVN